uniref:uncharacterized protein LOC101242058 n=1 Tax=Ciona intestinalis TaxID=7719 RepID=UPI000EF4CE9A|nr:uncharacterized protein LOC101242058 [Ciona intestinalis]|eukprot:XP_026690917.1 uncharacterized protein LOC101242058 [Ciona intestinalis]
MDLQHFLILVFLLNVAVAKKRYQTVTCETRGNDITTAVFRAICPSGCANYSIYSLWGTKRYTGDSRICSAAIHYGKITGPQRCLQQDIVTSAPVYKTRCPRGCEYRMNEVLGTPTQYSSRSSVCSAAIHAGEINEVNRIQCSKDAVGINGSFMFFCPPGCHRENYRVIGDGIYTEDTNICAAAIHDGQIPRDSSFTFEIPCGMTAENFKLNDRFTIVCPLKRDCWTERDKRAVYGKYVFSERSSLCRAAMHDRVVPYIYTGGVAHIRIVKGLPSYMGIYYAQIESESSGPTEKAFIFENGRDRFAQKESCLLRGSDFNETRFTVACYSQCDQATDAVWGYLNYTDSSYICSAAILSGKLMYFQYENVHVEILPGQQHYRSYFIYGGVSMEHGPWHRSFRFVDE